MNNIIFQSIRAVAVLSIALFAFASDVLASPILTPATATHITENSATLVGSASNPYKSTAVWFELIDGSGATTAVGVEPPLYDNGVNVRFEYSLRGLNAGQAYKYRSVAMEGGTIVYSQPSSFTTTVPKVTSTNVTYQSNSQTVVQNSKTTQATASVVAKKSATTTPVVTEEGFTNGNTASVIGAGSDIFPTTLIGWIALLIAILTAGLVGRMIYESTEKRKKARGDEEEDEDEGELKNK